MKKLLILLALLIPVLAHGQTCNQFKPATGILVGAPPSCVATAAATTGSGNVVLATSPTLVTPALGTPSALVLTNATGLPDGALSANVPLLNASNSFTGTTQQISNAEPRLKLNETDQGSDLKLWDIDVASGVLTVRTRTDADGAGVNALAITRGTTTAISNISIGNATNNPSYNFLGTGTLTLGGSLTTAFDITARKFVVTNNSVPANGIYLPTTNTFGIAANSTQVATFTTTTATISTAINAPNLATSSAATSGTLCWTTGTGLVNVDTTTTCLLSSRRYKQDINPLPSGLSEVMQLRPVSYQLRPEYNPTALGRQVGLIAEDVAAVDSRLVSSESDGSPHAVRYQQLTAVLVKAIQEQQHEIAQLRSDVAELRHTH